MPGILVLLPPLWKPFFSIIHQHQTPPFSRQAKLSRRYRQHINNTHLFVKRKNPHQSRTEHSHQKNTQPPQTTHQKTQANSVWGIGVCCSRFPASKGRTMPYTPPGATRLNYSPSIPYPPIGNKGRGAVVFFFFLRATKAAFFPLFLLQGNLLGLFFSHEVRTIVLLCCFFITIR